MLECVLNISEGRRTDVVATIAGAAGSYLLDVHSDPDHNRSVITVAGEDAAREVSDAAFERLDLTGHEGVHPRFGVVDVVPFVPLDGSDIASAVDARDRFAMWVADRWSVPCFVYGPERSLPEVRSAAFSDLSPTVGPPKPHPTAGACAVGARQSLVAYNLWLRENDVALAQRVANAIRQPGLRALGFQVGDRVQVSCNLVEPSTIGPADAYDLVATLATVEHAELVGLLPVAVLEAVPERRWSQLDLSRDRTIEARMSRMGR